MADMIEVGLTKIESLAATATPGPWRVITGEDNQDSATVCLYVGDDGGNGPGIYVVGPRHVEGADPRDDASFVAAARAAVPDLVAEVRRLRTALRKIANTTFGIQATDGKHWACGRHGCPACAARAALGESRG